MRKIMIDYDGVIVNTIQAIVSIYQDDFRSYKKFKPIHWSEIETWNFTELDATTPEYINTYFNQKRFFDRVEMMPMANTALEYLHFVLGYEICIVSSGYSPNLVLKEKWVKENIPYATFIGVNLKEYKDKSHVDMSGCLFVDDSVNNLETSNATLKICFGEEYEWNKNWDGIRIVNWCDFLRVFKDIESGWLRHTKGV